MQTGHSGIEDNRGRIGLEERHQKHWFKWRDIFLYKQNLYKTL